MTDLILRIAGEGGEGVISTGELLTTALARSGYDVFTFRTYPAEIKGGPAMFQIRAADHPVPSQGNRADVLLALNADAVQRHSASLRPDGWLIYDPDLLLSPGVPNAYGLPLERLTRDTIASTSGKNMAALGALGRLLGLPLTLLEQLVMERFSRKGEAVGDRNRQVLRAGYAAVDKDPRAPTLPSFPPRPAAGTRLTMSGNDALSLGAIHAGCRYFAGYPITPASDILEFMEFNLPKFGGAVVQTEDEIAAIASVIGASYAGKKAMTATSGPGLSLMVESLGLATMTETPCVLVDAQRGGPSTGLPTKTEQGDLNLACFGAHGDAPRIVLAPGDVEDCLFLMVQAFNLAEKYQTPVLVLSDQSLAHRTQTFPQPDFEKISPIQRLAPSAEELRDYRRYAFTPSGISPMAIPGTDGGCHIATGLEHNERGDPDGTSETHARMSDKRAGKIQAAAAEPGLTARSGPARARLGLIGWGSTQGVLQEATALANAEGLSVAHLQLKMVSPLPDPDLRAFLGSVDRVVVAELNHSGQLNRLIRNAYLTPTASLTKCDGLPFFAEDILDGLRRLAREGKAP